MSSQSRRVRQSTQQIIASIYDYQERLEYARLKLSQHDAARSTFSRQSVDLLTTRLNQTVASLLSGLRSGDQATQIAVLDEIRKLIYFPFGTGRRDRTSALYNGRKAEYQFRLSSMPDNNRPTVCLLVDLLGSSNSNLRRHAADVLACLCEHNPSNCELVELYEGSSVFASVEKMLKDSSADVVLSALKVVDSLSFVSLTSMQLILTQTQLFQCCLALLYIQPPSSFQIKKRAAQIILNLTPDTQLHLHQLLEGRGCFTQGDHLELIKETLPDAEKNNEKVNLDLPVIPENIPGGNQVIKQAIDIIRYDRNRLSSSTPRSVNKLLASLGEPSSSARNWATSILQNQGQGADSGVTQQRREKGASVAAPEATTVSFASVLMRGQQARRTKPLAVTASMQSRTTDASSQPVKAKSVPEQPAESVSSSGINQPS